MKLYCSPFVKLGLSWNYEYQNVDQFLVDYSNLSAIIVRDDWIREGNTRPHAKMYINEDAIIKLDYNAIALFEQ